MGLGESEWDRERHRRLMRQLACYKNLRSHMEAVEYHVPPAALENRQGLWFCRLIVRLGVNNYGVDLGHMDGRRRLDGSWLLDQGFTRGLGFPALWVRSRLRTNSRPCLAGAAARLRGAGVQERARAALCTQTQARERESLQLAGGTVYLWQANPMGAAPRLFGEMHTAQRNPNRAAAGLVCGARARQPRGQGLRLTIHARCGNPQALAVGLRTEDRRKLDGKYAFGSPGHWDAGVRQTWL